jgi:hypothetical protein
LTIGGDRSSPPHVARQERLRLAVAARGREHCESAALLGTQARLARVCRHTELLALRPITPRDLNFVPITPVWPSRSAWRGPPSPLRRQFVGDVREKGDRPGHGRRSWCPDTPEKKPADKGARCARAKYTTEADHRTNLGGDRGRWCADRAAPSMIGRAGADSMSRRLRHDDRFVAGRTRPTGPGRRSS